MSRPPDHVAAGWNDNHDLRWIEAGRLRLDEEDKDGAVATIHGHVGPAAWLSSTELAGLVRHLAGWFADDPSEALGEIEDTAKCVHAALDVWNDRARADEEHPPYGDLTRLLDGLIARCSRLREDLGKFADAKLTGVQQNDPFRRSVMSETPKPDCNCTPDGDVARTRRPALHQEHCAILKWWNAKNGHSTDRGPG